MTSGIRRILDKANKITVLTGAGVSTDSGVPDFQSQDESWKHEIPREEAMSIFFFKDDPVRFWEIYRDVFPHMSSPTLKPNRFHYFLADLETEKDVTIVTQNVDGLHSAAGSSDVIAMHGDISFLRCIQRKCMRQYPAKSFDEDKVPKCIFCKKPLKPDISLFGEGIQGFYHALTNVSDADLLVVAGTRLQVGPFNELPLFFGSGDLGESSIWVNRSEPPVEYEFSHHFIGDLSSFIDSVKSA